MLFSACLCTPPSAQPPPPHAFTLWQLPNQTPTQMMSYVIRTPAGNLMVIDGGNAGDATYLAEFIADLGNHVEWWFLTHPHSDHTDALVEILAQPRGMQIDIIYASMPSADWMAEHGSEAEIATYDRLQSALASAGRSLTELALGQELRLDGVLIEVLGIRNPEITVNAVNNQSIILRVSDAEKSVLFTGDLGAEAGEKARTGPYADRLRASHVQMAHHGQNGADEAFYRHVSPSYCLWPTPEWLWDNDNGGGPGSGPWKTLEVRSWMDKLPIRRHYLTFRDPQQIE